MTWHKNVTLRSTSPQKSIKENVEKFVQKRVAREGEERGDVRKHVYCHELVYFDSHALKL